MDLNKEAEEHAKMSVESKKHLDLDLDTEIWISGASFCSFQEGANSKYVKAKILQAQIDVLKEINDKCFNGSNTCKVKIQKLQQQLKQLEND
jgi:hypothetical protein